MNMGMANHLWLHIDHDGPGNVGYMPPEIASCPHDGAKKLFDSRTAVIAARKLLGHRLEERASKLVTALTQLESHYGHLLI